MAEALDVHMSERIARAQRFAVLNGLAALVLGIVLAGIGHEAHSASSGVCGVVFVLSLVLLCMAVTHRRQWKRLLRRIELVIENYHLRLPRLRDEYVARQARREAYVRLQEEEQRKYPRSTG